MNKNTSKIIEELITECECDVRIENGILDLYNTDHLIVLSEHMTNLGISENEIEEFITETGVVEGKYPERQAYNKEGWLVTFPSKEYRDAAIKKRTHFSSDPTHGKGGMNLYYKKKGKQKRQTQQATTTTQPSAPQKQQAPAQAAPATEPVATKKRTPEQEKAYRDAVSRQAFPSKSQDDALMSYIGSKNKNFKRGTTQEPSTTPQTEKPTAPDSEPSSTAPAIDVPVVTAPPKQYSEVSKKFASQKRWVATPYDEYHDAEGNVVAVVGLSGEIVPVKNTDREEYKIFAEKNMPT